MTTITLICENCGKSFDVRKGKEKKTCSSNCKKELRKKTDEKYYILKPCECCGNLFKSKIKEQKKYCSYKCSGNAKKIKSREIRKCLVCGNEFEERIKYSRKFCSETCRNIWQTDITNINDRIEKSKLGLIEKYGVDSLFKLSSFQKEIQKNNKGRSIESLKKARETIKKNRKIKLIARFNDINYQIIEFKENGNIVVQHPDGHIFENDRKLLVNRLNHNTELSTTLLPISAPKSTLEIFITNILDEFNIEYITNDRKLLSGKEIDILIKGNYLCIELNGLYWHSEYYLNKEYHLEKLNACNNLGYDLLQFFEDEIIEKPQIVKSMLLTRLNLVENKIFGRKCVIHEIQSSECKKFLIQNHIQGSVNSKIKIGLYYNNELVSLMTFGNKRKVLGNVSINNEYELLRFCNKLNTSVIGGASKLLKYFIRNYTPQNIISYANRRYSKGNLYEKMGFNLISKTVPNYFYVINKKREHRFKYRKDILVKEGFNPNMTEHEIMLSRNIPRIYDGGNLKYEMKIKNPLN